ncbi:hypothetical protein C1Y40_01195 [Mycobacterium talmoniae]|uniref:Uncharacterized protein n=1 Tax=Mycobacterium talmoniae TaxID=1858794 RepID=A0A2S8BPM1_9MYCO|nr:hypothetical protein C1Y40_01195 [Mycobacterium talmoniae]
MIRSAHTEARGRMDSSMVAISTAIRICMKYDRKATSEPICIWPASMRRPPNQISATDEQLMVRVVAGNISACQLPAVSAVSDRARLAWSNRSRSNGSRANARTTRTPDSWSRSTRLTLSISRCMRRNSGSIRAMIA